MKCKLAQRKNSQSARGGRSDMSQKRFPGFQLAHRSKKKNVNSMKEKYISHVSGSTDVFDGIRSPSSRKTAVVFPFVKYSAFWFCSSYRRKKKTHLNKRNPRAVTAALLTSSLTSETWKKGKMIKKSGYHRETRAA